MKNSVHLLKTWPEFFKASLEGIKKFEVRINDRDFQVGDILVLQEFFPAPLFSDHYSGRAIARTVRYIFPGGRFGLEESYVVLGVE